MRQHGAAGGPGPPAADAGGSRTLGLGSLLALGVNGIVGVGIFFVPSEVAARVPGLAGVGVYALVALALLPVAWTYATLGGHFDEDGGPYVWARAAFGPAVGFGVGWIAYVSALFSTSAVVAGLAEHAAPELGLHGATMVRAFATLCIAALAATVAVGLKPSAVVWNVVTVLKLVPLVVLAGLALVLAAPHAPPPLAAPRLSDAGRAALVVVFAMQGFEIVPVPAGNAKHVRRAIPVATLGSLVLAAVLYVVLHWACVRALPDLAHHAAPLVDAAGVYGGPRAAWLVGAGTNLSALGIAFGMFAMTPRYLAALGRPDALGGWIGNEARHVPLRALAITTAVVLVFVLAGRLSELFALSSVAVLAQYAVSAAALAVLAAGGKNGLGRRHLWPAPLAIGAILLIARSARAVELLVAGGALAVGAALLALHRLRRN